MIVANAIQQAILLYFYLSYGRENNNMQIESKSTAVKRKSTLKARLVRIDSTITINEDEERPEFSDSSSSDGDFDNDKLSE